MSNVKIKKTGEVGTVQEKFNNLLGEKILVVKLTNGDLIKCYESDIEYIKDDPEKKDEVTITRDEFTKIASKCASEECIKGGPILIMAYSILLAKLENRLFGYPDHD